MEDTIFERILRGEIPANVVFENDSVLAFRDIRPQAPVHVLVIPKHAMKEFSDLSGVDPAVASGFIQGVAACAAALGLSESGYRVVFNNGPGAGQEVPYLHAHILAGRTLTWPPG